MTDAQKRLIKKYPTANYMLKHKDAVMVCLDLLQKWLEKEISLQDLEYICGEFEQKCYIGSDKW